MDWKLELVAVPVSDVDRAKTFYTDKAGFNADHDHTVGDGIRFVQLTPPGSACSISIGRGVVDTEPGSVRGLQLVVPDVDAARAELVERGVEVGEVRELPGGRFVFFEDPDGNGWLLQEVTTRLPGAAPAEVETDITEDVIRTVALPLGLVDVKVCAVDGVWSGLKLVVRRSAR